MISALPEDAGEGQPAGERSWQIGMRSGSTPVVLDGEHRARAAEPGLHLVRR